MNPQLIGDSALIASAVTNHSMVMNGEIMLSSKQSMATVLYTFSASSRLQLVHNPMPLHMLNHTVGPLVLCGARTKTWAFIDSN